MISKSSYVNILLVEDNPGDIRLIEESLKQNKFLAELNILRDGEFVMDYLRKKGKYGDAVTPDLILLDLNLPKVDGRQLLYEIKSDEELKIIPVIVLTSSGEEEDVLKSYKLNANCYISKPVDLESFVKVVKSIESFWFTIVRLPG